MSKRMSSEMEVDILEGKACIRDVKKFYLKNYPYFYQMLFGEKTTEEKDTETYISWK